MVLGRAGKRVKSTHGFMVCLAAESKEEAGETDTAAAARMRLAVVTVSIGGLAIAVGGAALMGEHLPAFDHRSSTMVSRINHMLAIQRGPAVAAGLPVAGAAAVACLTGRGGHHGQAEAECQEKCDELFHVSEV
jgi:hypothetical protein